MGLVFVAESPDWDADMLEREPLVRVDPGGVYFFLYPRVLALQDETGQLIDSQQGAFFSGDALARLRRFVEESQEAALGQESEWQQRVGRRFPGGEAWYEPTRRDAVLCFLDGLMAAVEIAESESRGVLFIGE